MGEKRSGAKVVVLRCSSYDAGEVELAVRRGIDLLGGTSVFVQPGEKLLFKPNVLWGSDPAKCVITHPMVLRAAVCAFAECGAQLSYGDSPAGISQALPTMKKCRYDTALADLPVTLAPFDSGRSVHHPDGVVGKHLTIAEPVLEADCIVNLPKLKSHGLTRMTGAIKNLFGCLPMLTKGDSHARFPDIHDFSQLLVDIAVFVRPRLHIMDAVEAMEGNGPQSGTPKKLGVILVSADPVALDVVACRLIDLDPAHVPTITAGGATGLGCADFAAIELAGDALDPLIDRTFDVVRKPVARLPQNTLLGAIKRLLLPRPVIRNHACTRCGRCVSLCPLTGKALSQKEMRLPVYNYAVCIRCFCCQEVCPSGAIVIKEPLLRRLMPVASYLSLLITRTRARKASV